MSRGHYNGSHRRTCGDNTLRDDDLAVQNGDAPEPPDTSPINSDEFDGATQFKYVSFEDALLALQSD